MSDAVVNVEDLLFYYENKELLSGLTFHLQPGEIVSLIGSSGSGKTTIFKILAGILQSNTGKIALRGSIAYMTQEDLLLPWRTVLDNVLLPLELGKFSKNKNEAKKEAKELLKELSLEGTEEQYPHQLSGGMRQRVSLGRAFVQRCPILLLDEPFASLDVMLREQMYGLVRRLSRKHGTTILMVTHDFRDALALSDRVLLLKKGKIEQEWKVPVHLEGDAVTESRLLREMKESLHLSLK